MQIRSCRYSVWAGRLLAALILLAPASAATFAPRLTQYAHTAWRVQDSYLDSPATSVVQTKDGYIWIATMIGLLRFDGVRFQHVKLPLEAPLYSALAARDGTLWVGSQGALFHLRSGRFESTRVTRGRINDMLEDGGGRIWVVRTRFKDDMGPVCAVQHGALHCYGKADGVLCRNAATIMQDDTTTFWIGGDDGFCEWRLGGAGTIGAQDASALGLESVTAFAAPGDGSTYVGFARPGPQRGLQRLSGGSLSPVRSDGFDGATVAIMALLIDRQGALWIGTENDGLYHLENGRADHFTTANGLSSNDISTLFEDRERNVWVATDRGVDRFHEISVATFSMQEGLHADAVAAVLAARDGSIYMSNTTGVDILRNGAVEALGAKQGLPGVAATALYQTADGRLWIGVDNDLAEYRDGKFRLVRKPDGAKLGVIAEMAEDVSRDLWIIATGSPYRLYRLRNGRFLDEVALPRSETPRALSVAPGGAMWIATDEGDIIRHRDDGAFQLLPGPAAHTPFWQIAADADGAVLAASKDGLYHFANGRWSLLSKANGLPCSYVLAFGDDGHGSLWVRTQCGIAILDKPQIDSWWSHQDRALQIRTLDALDGASPGQSSFTPAFAHSADGRVWFSTDTVLLTADARRIVRNQLPPPVHVEQVVADHRVYPLRGGISLPPNTRDVEIDYSALSFVAPQKVQFRYQLAGFDKDWRGAGTRRAAFYTNLSPGVYRFQVIASNDSDVWNMRGDTVAFSIRPAFYQTLWFWLALAAGFLLLLWLVFTSRVRHATAQVEARLSERQAERIRIARELHDTLLQGLHGLLARFQVVANAIPPDEPAKRMMDAALDRADEILVQSRDRVRDLRSTDGDRSPLADEIAEHAFNLERDGSAPIELRSLGIPHALNPDVQHEVLAIACEALTNAAKHSQASKICCELTYSNSGIVLVCEDDGIGIDPETIRAGGRDDHWGLLGMQERARQIGGSLRLFARAPAGCRVELRVRARVAYHGSTARRRLADIIKDLVP